jgi:hypothetical protein
MSALITNYFHRHFTKLGSDEHICTIEPYQSRQRDTTNGDSTDVLDTDEIASTTSIGGYITATTTATTSHTATTTTTTKRHR